MRFDEKRVVRWQDTKETDREEDDGRMWTGFDEIVDEKRGRKTGYDGMRKRRAKEGIGGGGGEGSRLIRRVTGSYQRRE